VGGVTVGVGGYCRRVGTPRARSAARDDVGRRVQRRCPSGGALGEAPKGRAPRGCAVRAEVKGGLVRARASGLGGARGTHVGAVRVGHDAKVVVGRERRDEGVGRVLGNVKL